MAENNEGKELDDDTYLKDEQEKRDEIEEKSSDITNDGNNTKL